ncbi:MAG: GNAT family N-acetyltransferase [Acidovorax sp.]|jgi:GNAT superfamily N-acetyltransferase|nr:GNAT family N-acetyltransferase [Acidovorax sp.]
MLLRLARLEDSAALPPIERSAAQLFKNVPGLEWLADGDVMSAQAHERLIAQGSVWVAEAEPGTLVGFASAEVFGDELHLWELSVHADWQQQGVGSGLLRQAYAHAAAQGLAALTLTTFSDLPWNAPAYARLGFEPVQPLSERLHKVLDAELAHGLPAGRRVAMRRRV